MKRIILTAFVLSSFYAASAQNKSSKYMIKDTSTIIKIKSEPRFYANIHGGYSMALGSTFKFYPDDVSSITLKMMDNNIVSKDVKYSAPKKGLGEGFRIGGGISYILNDYVNVGLDIDYFRSTIRKTRDSSFSQRFSGGMVTNKFYNQQFTISYDADRKSVV